MKEAGSKMSRKATLPGKQVNHYPGLEPAVGVQDAAIEFTSQPRRPQEGPTRRGMTMAHPAGATSKPAHTKATDQSMRAPA